MDLTLLETPATVDIIDGEAIRARLDTNVLEAVTRSAGLTNESNPGNGNSSIQARGFDGQGSVTKLYDGTNYFTAASTITFPFDTWGVERIEVLKGPSSVLYGEGGIGGAINIIPRQPQRDRSGDVRVIMGENRTSFFGFDHTGSLGDSTAYRIDYSKSDSDNWVRDGKSEAEMLSLALSFDVSDDLELSVRYDMGEQKPMRYFGVPVVNGDFFDRFVESNFNVSDSEIRYEDDSIRLKADWQASDNVALQAELYRLSTERFWKNSEYYFYDDTAQLVERWDPLMIGHDMDHNGARAKARRLDRKQPPRRSIPGRGLPDVREGPARTEHRRLQHRLEGSAACRWRRARPRTCRGATRRRGHQVEGPQEAGAPAGGGGGAQRQPAAERRPRSRPATSRPKR